MATENEPDPVADFADAVGNGQIHPAVAGMFAHLDNRLSDLLDKQADRNERDPDDDDETGDKVPPRKATPSTVAGKAGHK